MTIKSVNVYLVGLLLTLLISSCGQTGPLYLRGEQAPIHVEDDETNEE